MPRAPDVPGPGGLREQLVAAGRSCEHWQRRVVHLATALDCSGEWALDGARTCAHWIAGALDVEVCTAREWVRIGRALAELPAIDAAFAAGRVSYSKVRALTRVATADNEAELCALAERTPAGRLSCALAAWLAGREAPEQTEQRQREARSLSWWLEPDGMVAGRFRLAPLAASALIAAIDLRVLRNRRPARLNAEGGMDASVDAWMPRSAVSWPSVAQQRADALVDIVRDGSGGGVVTEVVLHVRGDGCTLDDGTPIAGSVVERVAPSSLLRALIHDAAGRPINASGRQRHPTLRQQRVVHERDRACVDCGTTELLELDHEPAYEHTGHTVVDELRLRCWTCHRARHRNTEDAA
ncbi:MAG: DUF222 domain-containing protein [Acidimicrobiia bacterium]